METRFLLDLSRLQANRLSGFVIVEMLLMLHFIITDVGWPSDDPFIDFQPHVDIISEETFGGAILCAREVPGTLSLQLSAVPKCTKCW